MNEEKLRDFYIPAYKMRRKRKKSNIPVYEMVKDEARRFCLQTGMHGFQYIAKSDNTPTERFVWTFISFGALLTAIILSSLSWVYSASSPTLIVADSMQDPISNFLFPAVSICSLNKISKKKVFEFLNNTKLLKFMPDENSNMRDIYRRKFVNMKDILQVDNITHWTNEITLLAQLYFANYDTAESSSYNDLQNFLDKNNVTAENALVAITPNCQDMILSCMWKNRKIRCDRLFETLRTPESTCCSFFYYAMKNRSFTGYMSERYKPYPRRVVSCGHNSGLKVFIKHKPDDYMASEISAYGAKVIIHDPYAYPDWSAQKVLVPMGRQVYTDINPTKTYSTENIRALSIKSRKCVFKNERHLQLFNNYTHINCLTECRINIIGNICGCMPFYYRNEWFDWMPFLRMCNLRDIGCLSANKQRFMSSVPGYDTYQTRRITHKWGSETTECKCELDCDDRVYLVQSTMGKLSTKEISSNKQFFGGETNMKYYSVISVFFSDLTGTRNKRDVSFTWTSIFGLFGGLLGLCLGFSFLAIVDVIYTFTLRLGIDIMRKKKELLKVKQQPVKPQEFNVVALGKVPEKVKNYKYPMSDVWFLN